MNHLMHRLFPAMLALCLATGCGSSGNQPKFDALHAVNGTVLQAGKSVAGGVVRFTPDPDKPDFLINSEVGSDGKFKLSTVRTTDSTGERKQGAPAGKYKVTFMPPLGDQTTGYKEPVTLSNPITVEAKDNDLQIELPAK